MSRRLTAWALLSALFAIGSSAARVEAQSIDVRGPLVGSPAEMQTYGTAREYATNTIVLPKGWTPVTGELSFLTSPDAPTVLGATHALRFSDAVLFDAELRHSFGRVEVAVGTSLAPKKPQFVDVLPWQGANLSLRVALVPWLALAAQTDVVPMVDQLGYANATSLSLEARANIDRTITMSAGIGATGTFLFFQVAPKQTSWLTELAAHWEINFHAPGGEVAGWLGTDLYFPIYAEGSIPWPSLPQPAALEPQVRANFHIGGTVSYVRDWDFYARFDVLDRGDVDKPGSELPILLGGFDEQVWTLGVTHTFGTHEREPRPE